MPALDVRKQEILRTVIQTYIQTAEPVGSETVSRRMRLGVSSATIRNEMAALEQMGYLSHPHTSAGRVPTDRGYRIYVDAMLPRVAPTPQERSRIRRQFSLLAADRARIPEGIARMLAAMTEYTSVAAAPPPGTQVFKHLHLIPIASTQVMAVIVTDTGAAQGPVLDLPEPLDPEGLDRLSRLVSQRLAGLPLAEITDEVLARAVDEAAWQQRILGQLARWLRLRLPASPDRVYIEGTANMLKQPEFADARAARSVLSALEQAEVVADLLRPAGGQRQTVPRLTVWITIGSEHRHEALRGCSVVAAAYRLGEQAVGAFGLIGPTRMDYGRLVALVRYLAERLSDTLGAR